MSKIVQGKFASIFSARQEQCAFSVFSAGRFGHMNSFRVSGTLASVLHCSVQKERGLFLRSQKAKHLHS